MTALTFPRQPLHSLTNTGALCLLYDLTLTFTYPLNLVRAQVQHGHLPPRAPTQKWPGMKAVSGPHLPLAAPLQPHQQWGSALALPPNPRPYLPPQASLSPPGACLACPAKAAQGLCRCSLSLQCLQQVLMVIVFQTGLRLQTTWAQAHARGSFPFWSHSSAHCIK